MDSGSFGKAAVTLAIVAVCVELCVSANLLTWVGIPYVSEGGALPLKFHPGTDLLLIASLFGLASFGRMDPLLRVFFAGIGGCVLSVLVLSGPGNLIVLLDTFLPAGLLAVILARAPAARLRVLRRAMQVLLSASAGLALIEIVAQATLVPLYLNDAAYHPHQEDFRPIALFDHPLTGALMMMIALALPPAGRRMRLAYQGLIWAALVAFGGRMAIGVSIIAAVAGGGLRGMRLILLRDRRATPHILLAGAGLLLCAMLFAGALAVGLGDRLAGHLYWDESAQVRVAQWHILDQLSMSQLMFGTPRDQLLIQLNALRLGSGVEVIENFWLLMFVNSGIVGFPLFLLGTGALCVWCWRRTGSQGRALLLGMMVVASSSNSLGRKSTVLVCVVGAVACIPGEVRARRRERAIPWMDGAALRAQAA